MNKRIKKKKAKAKVSFKPMSSEALLRKQLTTLEKQIKAANSLKNPTKIKGKTDRTAQRKAAQAIKRETKRQYSAAMKTHYLQSIRTPFQYEGKLTDNTGYYAAIKKYNEYIDRGLIKSMSSLDKYETADAFMNILSEREQSDVMRIANEKAEQIMAREREEAATFAQRITEKYGF